jgi:hypothetical protein
MNSVLERKMSQIRPFQADTLSERFRFTSDLGEAFTSEDPQKSSAPRSLGGPPSSGAMRNGTIIDKELPSQKFVTCTNIMESTEQWTKAHISHSASRRCKVSWDENDITYR